MEKILKNSKIVVLKLGTNVIIKNGKFNKSLVDCLAIEIKALQEKGKNIIIITSGAIGMGKNKLGLGEKVFSVELQQACASVGQSILMNEYEKIASKHGMTIAQILLSQENFEIPKSLENLKKTIHELLKFGIIPIINENDAVATEELSWKKHFSDNDMLAALVAKHLEADLLLILTDVKGIYSCHPSAKGAKLIGEVKDIGSLKVLAGKKSENGRGGIEAKINAAKIATAVGVKTIVCRGRKGILKEIFEGKKNGTIFH